MDATQPQPQRPEPDSAGSRESTSREIERQLQSDNYLLFQQLFCMPEEDDSLG